MRARFIALVLALFCVTMISVFLWGKSRWERRESECSSACRPKIGRFIAHQGCLCFSGEDVKAEVGRD